MDKYNTILSGPFGEAGIIDEHIFKVPTPFVRCGECGGSKYINRTVRSDGGSMIGGDIYDIKYTCPKCKDSPLPGYIPQYYTPEQYRDWIRRENGLPEYELPENIPVWVNYDGIWVILTTYSDYKQTSINMVIATEAGKPPEDWKNE